MSMAGWRSEGAASCNKMTPFRARPRAALSEAGFLEDEARGYLEEASDAQEDFLETLAILSEVFIVGFVATPLFLVVILVVISLVGGQTIAQLTLLVYAVIPIGMYTSNSEPSEPLSLGWNSHASARSGSISRRSL